MWFKLHRRCEGLQSNGHRGASVGVPRYDLLSTFSFIKQIAFLRVQLEILLVHRKTILTTTYPLHFSNPSRYFHR